MVAGAFLDGFGLGWLFGLAHSLNVVLMCGGNVVG
jgi:hypothetical protein